MKVSELIEELKKLPEDYLVVVEADHSQTPMKATWVGEGCVEDVDEYMMENVDAADPDAPRVAVIQAY